jgi:hypothetical protein
VSALCGTGVPGTVFASATVMAVLRYALAGILVGHAIAHLPGFLVAWRLASLAELPYSTVLFDGRLDVGDAGIRAVGLAWLLAAAVFAGAAVGIVQEATWATRTAGAAVAASLVLCIAGWPAARIGVFVNLALAALLLVPGALAVGLHGRS